MLLAPFLMTESQSQTKLREVSNRAFYPIHSGDTAYGGVDSIILGGIKDEGTIPQNTNFVRPAEIEPEIFRFIEPKMEKNSLASCSAPQQPCVIKVKKTLNQKCARKARRYLPKAMSKRQWQFSSSELPPCRSKRDYELYAATKITLDSIAILAKKNPILARKYYNDMKCMIMEHAPGIQQNKAK